jgi:hypothetical protein
MGDIFLDPTKGGHLVYVAPVARCMLVSSAEKWQRQGSQACPWPTLFPLSCPALGLPEEAQDTQVVLDSDHHHILSACQYGRSYEEVMPATSAPPWIHTII